MMRTFIPLLIVFSSCNYSGSNSKGNIDSSVAEQSSKVIEVAIGNPTVSMEKNRLLGIWTDGSTENATFAIGTDSIFYVDQMTSFPYTLKGDSLTIVFPDMSFHGNAKFCGDTLVLSDPEFSTTKYTRFIN